MKETLVQPVQIQAIRGINETPAVRLDELDLMENVVPDQTGRQTRMLGKSLIEKRTSAVMTIHQFWTAYGYGSRLSQTGGGVISDPEPPGDPGVKEPHVDYPLTCKPAKPYSNKLVLQYINRLSDFIHLRYSWGSCSGTDFDSRTSLIECSIPGVPVNTGNRTAIVGYFQTGAVETPILDFDYLGKNILSFARDNANAFEDVVINLQSLRDIAGNAGFTARFRLRGYFYGSLYPGQTGNTITYITPKEKGKFGSYMRYLISSTGAQGFVFYNTKNYKKKSINRQIVTHTNNPADDSGDIICYLYVKFNPKAKAAKDRIWIDDV